MKRSWIVLVGVGVVAIVVVVAATRAGPRNGREIRASLVPVAAPASPADSAGFASVEPGTVVRFPEDRGPHEDYQTEWWYYTGNLQGEDGRRFGYQLTFFRRALAPAAVRTPRESAWATNQVYLAHFALTDVNGKAHYAYEKLARGAGGLAGAQANPYRVWLESWSVTSAGPANPTTPYRTPPEKLSASAGDVRLDLDLTDLKGPTLQGDRGYSQKGAEPGNASIYYSLTRMAATGTVVVQGRTFAVSGLGWMDHEYSTSALGRDQVGWDWFSLQLDDNTELMLFQLRRSDGTLDAFSSGTLIAADGSSRRLGPAAFTLQPTGRWRSPASDAEYPSGWRLEIPAEGLSLSVTPNLADQELNVSYTYWEGAVSAAGTWRGAPVSGSGYVELTGYAGTMQGQF